MSGKDIRETVGLLLVVASMVFVGLQIRQNNNLAQAAAYQAIGIASAQAWDNQAHDREFLQATQSKEPAAMDTIDWRQRAAKFIDQPGGGCLVSRVGRGGQRPERDRL